MNTRSSLEMRLESLEASLARTRSLAGLLALCFFIFVLAAFRQEGDELRTSRLILMEGGVSPGVSLVAGPDKSLILQAPDGSEIMKLGGDPVRRVGED